MSCYSRSHEVFVTQRFPLQTVLSTAEADRLAELLPFYRRRSPSGKGIFPEFVSPEDHDEAERLIAEWRSER